MRVEAVAKLVRFDDESVLGFLVSAGGTYTVAITKPFGVEHDVVDMDIAQWFDLPERVVVPVGKSEFAMLDRNIGFFEESRDTAVDYMGDRKIYYGYLFDERHVVPLDSKAAWERMIKEAKNREVL